MYNLFYLDADKFTRLSLHSLGCGFFVTAGAASSAAATLRRQEAARLQWFAAEINIAGN
jgi:hypothetical protein